MTYKFIYEFMYMKNIVKSYLKSCVPRFQMSPADLFADNPANFLLYMILVGNTDLHCRALVQAFSLWRKFGQLGPAGIGGRLTARKNRKVFCKPFNPLPRLPSD